MSQSISVIGAGSVGVSTALHLQQRGWDVTLIDRLAPGKATSYGNAGIINSASMIPVNSPAMHKSLPSYLRNNKPQLRYKPGYIARNLPWTLQFLQSSKTRKTTDTAAALFSLTSVSLDEHKAFMQRAGNMHRLSEKGWLRVYRNGAATDPGSFESQQFERFDIPGDILDADGINDLEPSLKRIYSSGFLLSGAASVNNPGALVDEYAQQFITDGGTFLSAAITSLEHKGGEYHCHTNGEIHRCKNLVVAAGPWSRDVLEMLNYVVPLRVERGYHMHYNLQQNAKLNRSVHDVQCGFIMSPMEMGLRITSGVELNDRDAPPNHSQLEQVLPSIREAIDLGDRTDAPVWQGNRPTLPDSKPAIGTAPGHQNLWVAFGHQHIGLMTGPVTGRALAELISGEKVCIDLSPFTPARYLRHSTRRRPVWETVMGKN